MKKRKEEIKKELDFLKKENKNLKWLQSANNDDLNHLNWKKAEKILKNPKYFDKKLGILDLSKTKYQVIDEFTFHSLNIKEVKFPKSLIIIAKYSFANNNIESLNLSENKNLEIIEDYSFAYNNIKTFIKSPNIFLYTKKCLLNNPISISFKN